MGGAFHSVRTLDLPCDVSLPTLNLPSHPSCLPVTLILTAADSSTLPPCRHSYDTSSALALIDAAESLKSPAMILLFPLTLRHHRGIHFLRFILDVAHAASVPIAVHLDHATTVEDINMVLDFADQGVKFDSIMIDASHAPTPEENLQLVIPHIKRATQLGIPVEVELGRLEGGEAGLRVIDEGELTDPKVAEGFMRGSGAVVLAPSIGNLHGRYLKEPAFRLDM